MPDDSTDKACSICYESQENLRMLPCWHVACLTCILNMSQIGQGRALKCHLCREAFLFENVRSLPQPLLCSSCHQFLRNPKQLDCCSTILCSDCFANKSQNGKETVECPNKCTNSRHQLIEILVPRICPQCFVMHTNHLGGCGHSLCGVCSSTLSLQQRNCRLCDAVASPMPIPINPAGQNNGVLGQNNTLYDGGQPISQMHLLAAVQTLRIWNQRNERQRQQTALQRNERQLPQTTQIANYTKEQFKQDFPKGFAVLIAMAIVAYGWGLTYWLWIVMGLYFLILRPSVAFINGFVSVIGTFLTLYTMYLHFFTTLLYVVLTMLLESGLNRLIAIGKGDARITVAVFIAVLLKCLLTWIFFPSVFMYHAVIYFVVFTSVFLVTLANSIAQ